MEGSKFFPSYNILFKASKEPAKIFPLSIFNLFIMILINPFSTRLFKYSIFLIFEKLYNAHKQLFLIVLSDEFKMLSNKIFWKLFLYSLVS